MKRIELFATALTAALLLSSALAPLARAGFQEGVTAYEAEDYKTAFDEWLPLARNNDPAAMRNIGHMYRRGLGVAQDFTKAMTWYKRAATIGFDRAQANVAGMYLVGEGVERDYAQAASWFARAAQQGHVISQYNLGLLLENGLGVKKDERMALGWFELAAKAGHPGAREKAAELTALLKDRKTDTAEVATPAASTAQVTESADAAETDVSTQTAAAPVKTETAAPASETQAAPEPKDGLQKKGFYAALRSLITKKSAGETAAEPVETAAEPAETAVNETSPADEAVKDAIEPATSGAVTRAEEPPKPATKPALKPAIKPEVAAVPQEPVTVAAIPAPTATKTAAAPSTRSQTAPGSGLSLAEKLEMADLAYSLQQYQQSLSIWAPLAADGNAEAQYRLGVLFSNGQGVPVDRVRAWYWWEKAATNGSGEAASALGSLEETLTHLEKRQIDRVN